MLRDPVPQTDDNPTPGGSALIVVVGGLACAIPLEHVEETLRPLPVEPLAGAPSGVRGLSVIRGAAVPVVDLAALLGAAATAPTRFVTLRVGRRRVAAGVDRVVGVRRLEPAWQERLAPMMGTAGADVVESLGVHDAQLLLVLRAARLVPDAVWAVLDARAATP